MTTIDRNTHARNTREQFLPHVHAALKQAFTIEGFGPENTVAVIVHKDSPVCPDQARVFCEQNGQSYAVMCGARMMIANEILKARGKNGKPLFERTSQVLSVTPDPGYVYVILFEENWASVSPILWTEAPPETDATPQAP